MQGPWLYLKEKPRPAMDDDLYKWGVSKEAVPGTLGHQKQQQQVGASPLQCLNAAAEWRAGRLCSTEGSNMHQRQAGCTWLGLRARFCLIFW